MGKNESGATRIRRDRAASARRKAYLDAARARDDGWDARRDRRRFRELTQVLRGTVA